jgi:hypothetical protein
MKARTLVLSVALALFLASIGAEIFFPSATAEGDTMGWSLWMTPMPANFAPAKNGEYIVVATNVGEKVTTGEETTLALEVPAGLEIKHIEAFNIDPSATAPPLCTPSGQTITCKTTEPLHPDRWLELEVRVAVPALTPAGTLEAKASVKGGGAAQAALASTSTPVQGEPVPFDFLPGFVAPASSPKGTPEILAGSHPFQQTVSFGFPTKNPGDGLTNAGHPRNISVELPRGMAGNPAATPVLCTEAQLTGNEGCPDESQVGVADATTLEGEEGANVIFTSSLYNMVPPPGSAAELATEVADAGVFVHVLGGVRSESDYGIEALTPDVIAFGQQPIFNFQAQIWGDPSAKAHDSIRGKCHKALGSCPVPEQSTAFLAMPGDCPLSQPLYKVLADSWEKPSPPFAEQETAYASADSEGKPALIEGCEDLQYKPTLTAQPQTNASDSPTGLDSALRQPQETDKKGRYTAALKDLSVHLPQGLVVNPSQAAGLGACTQAQIGFNGESEGALSFSKAPQSCPDAAKIGTLTATSPLLVGRDENHKVLEKEGNPVLEELHGALYLAKPFANPFGSLIALYFVVEDAKTGIVAKLAGKGELDPQSGQISVQLKEAPELPLQEVGVHVFGGPRGALTTPPTCGEYATASELTPWSAPPAGNAFAEDSFEIGAGPNSGPCPATVAQMPHAPAFSAGTLSPAAGTYSPLLMKLSRADGSQRWSRLEATLPLGLSAKLAGVGECSGAQIAKARSREVPNQGSLEQADPSCPASSQLGTFTAAAGSGPTPYYAAGRAYLSGPYKGAPLSVVAIAPAVAGPFDLGTVVIRNALYLDPTTAQGRIVSDPFPQILDGVPVDLRSVAIKVDRPNFTRNPTSCAEKSFAGTLTSALGTPAALFQRFQVGGCSSLPYKPKLSARLFGPIHRGGHPRFRAILTAKPGEANTASLSFTLPHSEFIDQGHFRTICTRVQFAANQCPAGSVYGYVKATSPLVDYTLQGPIYLRSSNHTLPDAVAALRGPPSQPIEIDAVARIDSVKGRLRSRVETVPDAPITKVIVSLQGGKKGLFQNSTNICKGAFRISASFEAQNGKAHDTQPPLKAQCKGKGKGAKPTKSAGHR